MHRSFCLAILFVVATASGQTITLVQNTDAPAGGADFPPDHPRFSFDLIGNTSGADWYAAEVSVDVFGGGRIWHASDERLAYDPHPSDPNGSCYLHNLQPPGLLNTAENRQNSLMYDTFVASPGAAFTTDPTFVSPGADWPGPGCPSQPRIVSTDARIRGVNPQGLEMPLAWYDLAQMPLANTVMARFTFETWDWHRRELSLHPHPWGIVFARIHGRSFFTDGPFDGDEFSFLVYAVWVPEPGSVALLLVAAIAMNRRR